MSPSLMMQKDFQEQLIKGKITEIIFDQMFREVGGYTVIPFGYESIVPGLMQATRRSMKNDLLENLRNAPDFALVDNDTKEVRLVEVKYRASLKLLELRKMAASIQEKWKEVWLFVATPQGFYLDRCEDLAKSNSRPLPLQDRVINYQLQTKYLNLLKEFIQ